MLNVGESIYKLGRLSTVLGVKIYKENKKLGAKTHTHTHTFYIYIYIYIYI